MAVKKGGELSHYGVLGMKWGRRRDKGNSAVPRIRAEERAKGRSSSKPARRVLTEKGSVAKTSNKAEQRQINSRLYTVTDADLRERINRIQLETQYLQLTTPPPSKAAEISKQILKTVGPTLAVTAVSAIASQKLEAAVANKTMTAEQAQMQKQLLGQVLNTVANAVKK